MIAYFDFLLEHRYPLTFRQQKLTRPKTSNSDHNAHSTTAGSRYRGQHITRAVFKSIIHGQTKYRKIYKQLNVSKLTACPLFCNGYSHVCQTSLLLHATLAQILDAIRCTNRSANIETSWTNTLRFVVHYSAADIVGSTAALGPAGICKMYPYKLA